MAQKEKSAADVLPPELVFGFGEWSRLARALRAARTPSEIHALNQQKSEWEHMHGVQAKGQFERAEAYLASEPDDVAESPNIEGARRMRLDWNLVRRIVLVVENSTRAGLQAIEGHSADEVGYHAHLVIDMGLAEGYSTRNQGHQYPHDEITNLTAAGYEFAELARDQNRWDAAMSVLARRGSVTLAALKQLLANPGMLSQENSFTQVDPEFGQISITTNRTLHFIEFYGGRSLTVGIGGPQLVPVWVRHTEAFKHCVEDGSIVVNGHPVNQSDSPPRPQPLPSFVNSGTPEFWRDLRSRFVALLTEQRSLGITETHERWLRGSCFYPLGYEDLSRCRVRTGINGQIVSDFQDLATQAAIGLGCPSELDPVTFWLYCLAENLVKSDRQEIRSEIIGDIESGGIVQDLIGSSAGFCARLAKQAEQERIKDRARPTLEVQPLPLAPILPSRSTPATAAEIPEVSQNQERLKMPPSGAGSRDYGASTWRDLQVEFERHAAEYDQLAADFDSLRPGRWALIRAASPRVERIFREIAARAAAKAELSPPHDKTEPWQLWLEFMRSQGWRRPERPSAQSGSVRQVRSWQAFKRLAEESARTLPRVFQTSADCCRDLEERQAAHQSVKATDSGAAGSEPDALQAGPPTSIVDDGRGSVDLSNESDERASVRGSWLDGKLARHESWSSDNDIAQDGGPAYNTIQRYRRGELSTRDLYVRRKFAEAFKCAIDEVPA